MPDNSQFIYLFLTSSIIKNNGKTRGWELIVFSPTEKYPDVS